MSKKVKTQLYSPLYFHHTYGRRRPSPAFMTYQLSYAEAFITGKAHVKKPQPSSQQALLREAQILTCDN